MVFRTVGHGAICAAWIVLMILGEGVAVFALAGACGCVLGLA